MPAHDFPGSSRNRPPGLDIRGRVRFGDGRFDRGIAAIREVAALVALTLACILAVGFTAPAPPKPLQAPLLYRDSTAPLSRRVADLLSRMTPEEKFWQLYMVPGDPADAPDTYRHGIFGLQLLAERHPADTTRPDDRAVLARRARDHADRVQHFFVDSTRLGIPAILFEEGVHGLIQQGATMFPAAIGLAASWDTALMLRVSAAIAGEARARGIRQLLAPVINIASDVRWGRVEETYGEDPHLASRMALAYIRPLEAAGIITTPKHFVANVGEGGRDSYPIDLDRRLLEEIHLPPFRAAIEEGRARSIMAAYNSVDGLPASASRPLLTDLLRGAWGFGGFVISDQAGVGGANVLHFTSADYATSTRQSLEAGLDVIFQSSVDQAPLFEEAFIRGAIAPAAIDSAVSRVLRAKFELGLFEHPYVASSRESPAGNDGAGGSLAREAARESFVLLRNEKRLLPLAPGTAGVAVIGTDAREARLGGYSLEQAAAISILDGIRERIGAGQVRFAPGPGRLSAETVPIPAASLSHDSAGRGRPGLSGEYFDNITLAGEPRVRRIDPRIDFAWPLGGPARGIPRDWYSARWTGTLTPTRTGPVQLGVAGNDGYRLWIGGSLVIDNWEKRSWDTRLVTRTLVAGRAYPIRLEYFETRGNGRVRLVWTESAAPDWRRRIREAAAVAAASRVAVVVAGLEEGEFRDRSALGLPGHQEELIQAVAATGTPTVVVLVGGSAVTMGRWLGRVDAVLDTWYPGEEGGRAIAEVLFGGANPAGRLPVTFPVSEGQLPLVYNHKPTGRGDDYVDGTGQALFPFGYGLSYSRFEYSNLRLEPSTIAPGDTVVVRCRVKNLGPFPGDEVVQLYVRDLIATTAQPVLALKGFRRIPLGVGEEREVTFTLRPHDLEILDADLRRVVEPGEFRIWVGGSSRDLRLRGTLTVR